MSGEKEDVRLFLSIVWRVGLGFFALLAFGLALGTGCDSVTCGRLSEQTGKTVKFDWWTGCYVRVGGEWIPSDRWRNTE